MSKTEAELAEIAAFGQRVRDCEPILERIFADVQAEIFERWKSTPVHDDEAQKACRLAQLGLEAIRDTVEQYKVDGKLAQNKMTKPAA